MKDILAIPARSVRASAPATCGELAQGWVDGRDFLVNSPISLSSEVSVTLTAAGEVRVTNAGAFAKLASAVAKTLALLSRVDLGAVVTVHSNVPRGKGLASSTSELVAGVTATAATLGRRLTTKEVTRILLEVDGSSDGVHLPGVSVIDHLEGDTLSIFLEVPLLSFLVVDTGGVVETGGFDRERARAVARSHEREIKAALDQIHRGFETGDPSLIAAGATLSARVNQEVLPKGLLEDLIGETESCGALGVNCAHTGTVLGVMFVPSPQRGQLILERVQRLVPRAGILGTFRLVSGGARFHVTSSPGDGEAKDDQGRSGGESLKSESLGLGEIGRGSARRLRAARG